MIFLTNRNMQNIFILPMALFFILLVPAKAQQIKATVTLRLERLPLEKQQKLNDLAGELETYLSDYDWTGEYLDEPIPVTVQIVLVDQSTSYESRYQASFLISNGLDFQIGDKYWRFPYQDGDPLLHDNNNYQPFVGFLDYYIYLVLGWEYDKMDKFAGQPYYERAQLISNQARFNTAYLYGWEERTEDINYFLSIENRKFRQAKDLLFLGLSYIGEVDSTARRYCGQAIQILQDVMMKNPANETAQRFIQAHLMPCVGLFDNDPEILDAFIRMDPDHADTYLKYKK